MAGRYRGGGSWDPAVTAPCPEGWRTCLHLTDLHPGWVRPSQRPFSQSGGSGSAHHDVGGVGLEELLGGIWDLHGQDQIRDERFCSTG